MKPFLQRTRERKLVQWGFAYLAGGWALLQALDLLGNNFGWPASVVRIATVLLAAGLCAVLILAWYHGERGHQRVSAPELILLVALLVIAGAGVWLVARPDAGTRAVATAGEFAPAPTGAPAAQSIAVLPFVNMSADPANEYFSDGITEEILNALAKVPGLKVSARTSSFQFKGQNIDIRDAAQKLGVSNVLEGSVQRVANRVRITAQLVSARDGYHLWSQKYDRDAKDIFAVQDEISRAIVDTLRLRLAVRDAPLVSAPTGRSEAHDLYLRGRFFLAKRDPDDLRRAGDLFQQAIRLDSSYAAPYAGLADVYLLQNLYGGGDQAGDFRDRVERAARRALAHDSTLAEAHASLGVVRLFGRDIPGAEREIGRALAANPNYATAHQWHAYTLLAGGKYDDAVAAIRRAYELDPLSLVIGRAYGVVLADNGQVQEGIEQLERTIDIDSTNAVPHGFLALTYSRVGRHAEAEAEARAARRLDPENLVVLQQYAIVLARAGKRGEAEAALRELERRGARRANFHLMRAQILITLGKTDEAFRALDRHARDPAGSLSLAGYSWLLGPLRADPRWPDVARRLQLPL